VCEQLVGSGDSDGAQLAKRRHGRPELPVALEHQHHAVALLHTQRGEVVGRLVRQILDILEGEAALLLLAGKVQHSQLFGILAGHGVHDVEAEVELIGIGKIDGFEGAVLVLFHRDELVAAQLFVGMGDGHVLFLHLRRSHGLAVQNHGQEQALLAAHGNHAVRGGGVVINTVALIEDFHMLADLHLQGALVHKVELLTGMGGQMDGLILLLRQIVVAHPIGLGDFLTEHGRKVLNADAAFLGGGDAAILAGDGVVGQMSAVALQKVGQFNTERQSALVDKGKGQINQAGFILHISRFFHLRADSHFRRGITHDVAHLTDTQCHFLDLLSCLLHIGNLLANKKTAPKLLALRRVYYIRGTTQIAAFAATHRVLPNPVHSRSLT